jgi:hypothetical protein
MDLIQLLIVLVVVVVVTLVACFWLLSWAGLTHPLVFRR